MALLNNFRLVALSPAECGHDNCKPEETELFIGPLVELEKLKAENPGSVIQQQYEHAPWYEWKTVRK